MGQLVPVVQAARRPRHSPVNARHGDRYGPAWRIPAKPREVNIRAGWPGMRARAGITAANGKAPNGGYRVSRDQAAITVCDDGPP